MKDCSHKTAFDTAVAHLYPCSRMDYIAFQYGIHPLRMAEFEDVCAEEIAEYTRLMNDTHLGCGRRRDRMARRWKAEKLMHRTVVAFHAATAPKREDLGVEGD